VVARVSSAAPLHPRRAATAHRHHDDLRRHTDPHRHDAAAEPARHDEIALFPHVSIGKTVAIARRHHRRITEQPDLTAVRVAAQHQRHALRHLHGDVGLMRHEDDRRIVRDLRERAGQVVNTDAPPGKPLGDGRNAT